MRRSIPALLSCLLSLCASLTPAALAQEPEVSETDSMISSAKPLSTRKLSASQSCHVYAGYVVRVTADTQIAGQHLSVFNFASGADAAKTCALPASQAAFNLRNDEANWLLGLSGKYLFVDSGTGTGRRLLRVYDIGKAKAIFKSDYLDKVNMPVLANGRYLSYDKFLQHLDPPLSPAEQELCPETGAEMFMGLYKPFRLDLSTGNETATGKASCTVVQ